MRARCALLPKGWHSRLSAPQISALVKLANEYRLPVYPRGAGSGMVGACLPQGGLVIVTNRLNRILEIDADNMTAVLEPGVITGEFQKAVAKYGLLLSARPGKPCLFRQWEETSRCAPEAQGP